MYKFSKYLVEGLERYSRFCRKTHFLAYRGSSFTSQIIDKITLFCKESQVNQKWKRNLFLDNVENVLFFNVKLNLKG
jgi:hypothetical protein